MKKYGILLLVVFFGVASFLSGCTETPEEIHGRDTRLVGEWQNQGMYSEILTFYSDGTYNVEEGETANWSTAAGGRLWMNGVLRSYALSENDTVLNITQEGYTQTYRKV